MKHSVRNLILPLLGLACTLPAVAAPADTKAAEKTPWYEVSLVIFKHRNSPMGNEKWPTPDTLDLSFPKGILALEPAGEATTTGDGAIVPLDRGIPFRNGTSNDSEFQGALRSIQLSSNYEIISKASWKQPALDRDQAIPVLIQAGNEYGGYYELEGSVTLVVSRYLHIQAELWLSEYIQQVEMIAPWWESSNTITDSAGDDSLAYQQIDFSSRPAYSETVTRYESVRTVVLNESRRMRSGELHYLDNPMFGVMVKVVPYELPSTDHETLQDALPESSIRNTSPVSLR